MKNTLKERPIFIKVCNENSHLGREPKYRKTKKPSRNCILHSVPRGFFFLYLGSPYGKNLHYSFFIKLASLRGLFGFWSGLMGTWILKYFQLHTYIAKISNVNSRPKESPNTAKIKIPSRNSIVYIIRLNKLVFLTSYAKCSSSAWGFLADLNLCSPQGKNFLPQILMKIDISLRLFLIWICIDLAFIFLL